MAAPRPTLGSTKATLVAEAASIRSLIDETNQLDAMEFENCSDSEIRDSLATRCLVVGDNARLALCRLLDALAERPADHLGSPHPVDEMCFIARMDISRLSQQLAGLMERQHAANRDQLLLACDHHARRVRKGLEAVSWALSEKLDLSFERLTGTDLVASLAVRREYARLYHQEERPLPDSPEELLARVRSVGNRLSKLMGSSAYGMMRLKDRLMFRELRSRILTWLGSESSSFELGTQLLSDFETATKMLRQINLRAELREHDRLRLEAALTELQRGGAMTLVRKQLRAIYGLDSQLDELLNSPNPPQLQQLLEAVQLLLSTIRGVEER